MRDIVLQAVDNGKLITEFYPKSNYKIEIDWDQKLKLFEFNSRTETYTEDGDTLLMPDWEKVEGGIIRFPTGLKDRNGNESHHKDIVEFEGSKYVIEWDEVDSGFYLAYYKELDDPDSDEHLQGKCIRESEIIGNIYQNKELIS